MLKTQNACLRSLCVLLALLLLLPTLSACSGKSEIPDGYQYATCEGEYFRLFVPTQWTVNTSGGVSGATLNIQTAVTMTEVSLDGIFPEGALTDEEGNARAADLDDFDRYHLSEVSAMRNFAEDKHYKSTLSGYRAVDMTYSATVAGEDYTFRQVLCKVDGRFYLFTYSAPSDVFEVYADVAEDILSYVRFYSFPYEAEDAATRKIPQDVTLPEGMKLVSTDEVAYRFFVPDSWTVDMEVDICVAYVTETDRSCSNVSMMSYNPEIDGFSVADYWEMCRLQYEDALPDFTVTGTEETTMGGRKATVYEYTYTLGGVTYKTRQSMCVYATMVYALTYTALPENYDSHLEEVERMQEELIFRTPFGGQ